MSRITTTELVTRILAFCELYSGIRFYPYQEQFARRIIRSVLENDGSEITALFSRQSGKSETIATVVGGMMIILPKLANMPMFAGDKRLEMFKDGLWVGIFAPSQRQAQITYGRMKTRLQSRNAIEVLNDPDFRLTFTTSNGQTVALTNGSFATAISASDNSSIEGESFKFIIAEEAQDISNFKLRKCLTGDTRVLLKDGSYKAVKMIVEDKLDEVVLYDAEMRYLVSSKPLEFYDNGVQDVYKLRLNNGDIIEATLNHQFYTYSKNTKKGGAKFRTVQEIIDSFDKYSSLQIGVPDRLPYFADDEENDYEKGLIVGYFLGNGCLVGTPKFIGDLSTNKRLHFLIRKVVGEEINMTEYNYNPDNGMQEVCFSTDTNKKGSNTLVKWLKEFGIYNLTRENKCLPDKQYSKSFYRGFIEALIETDGCIERCTTKPIISFANISEKLVKQLKDVYLKFGIHATLFSKDNSKGFSDNTKPLWLLHVKSILDIRRFNEEIILYRKQVYLDEAIETIKNKRDRNTSKNYPSTMRFYKVTSVEYVGKKPTYCLKTEGRNFIANNMISSNSIHPMGAAYNATIAKIGTATTYIGDFYDAIKRNIQEFDSGIIKQKNHFQYDYKVVMKYNPKYAKYIEKEKFRLGENSDEFRMSYGLEWILERSMFVGPNFEDNNGDTLLERVFYDKEALHTVGIDLAKKSDSTVVTVVEVDWSNPVVQQTLEENGFTTELKAYTTILKDWLEIQGDDYNEQFFQIVDYLKNFNVKRVYVDATAEASFADRLKAELKCEVLPFVFTSKSKSDVYKFLDTELKAKRAKFPRGSETVKSREYKRFTEQFYDLQKSYRGQTMVVSHPPTRDGKDDYCDSYALAVYAAREECSDLTVEVSNNKFFTLPHQVSHSQRGINRLTARRR